MTDDVIRLRRLRRAALKTRALAAVLRESDARRDSYFQRGAVLGWQLARIATGRLRAHPDPALHRDQSGFDTFQDGMAAIIDGLTARGNDRRVSAFTARLKLLSREVDDTRALTLAPDLSDALGRAQHHMRKLLLDGANTADVAKRAEPARAPHVHSGDAVEAPGSPYLAL